MKKGESEVAQSRKISGSKRALREAKKRDRNKCSQMIRYRYLIACEGKVTEPNYFKEINTKIPRDIVIIAKGDGYNTLSLVKWAEAEKNNYEHNGEHIDEVWIVMDRDSFPNHKFDNAIKTAKAKGYKSAWSNECFELWILLHFRDIHHSMPRAAIYKELSKIFNLNYSVDGKNKNLYSLLRTCAGIEDNAMIRAEKLWANKNVIPSKANPATGIFELIKILNQYIIHR